jgi:DNA-binding transcriptional MerR regulator
MTDMREAETAALQWQSRNTPRRAGTQLTAAKKTRKDMEALGVSRRQLEYWVEMGWVSSADPPSQGHPRTFSGTEKRVLALMARLTAAGLPARRAAPAARQAVEQASQFHRTEALIELVHGVSLRLADI